MKKSRQLLRRVQIKISVVRNHRDAQVGENMDEQNLIYDWNVINYEYTRDANNHPHDVWFDDETLRDGLQSPSALNPLYRTKN